MNGNEVLWGLIIFVVAFVLGMLIGCFGYEIEDEGEIKELGQSICDQEYDMDFESYDEGELNCKPSKLRAERKYDGITIKLVFD